MKTIEEKETTAIRIPADANLHYLPLVYVLPWEEISKHPVLRELPRIPHQILTSAKQMDIIADDEFLKEIMDAVSSLAFPHFGFRGWKEHYSGSCPVWIFSYSLPIWAREIDREIGMNLQRLFYHPRNLPFAYPPAEEVSALFEKIVKRVIQEQNWQPVLDVIKEMPCEEDFEPIRSKVRTDFLRKWYHTRSKNVQTVSLEQTYGDESFGPMFFIPDASSHVEEHVISKVFLESFLKTLSERDLRLLNLRQMGYNWKEIAVELGYASHSGVLKRVDSIMKRFDEYGRE